MTATQTPPPIKITTWQRIKTFVDNRTQKQWAIGVVIVAGGVFAVSIFSNIFATNETITVDTVSESEKLARYTDTSSPLAMMGSTAMAEFAQPETTADRKLELIYGGLESFDRWLAPTMDDVIHRELAREALRLQEAALVEANTGNFDTTDPLNDFDFASCLTSLPGDRCVLLRYAGEGIALFSKCINGPGDEPVQRGPDDHPAFSDPFCNDKPNPLEGPPDAVYGMTFGYLRMRAALLALGDFNISSQTKLEAPLHALSNYRETIYQALKLSPAAIAPVTIDLPNAMGHHSPAEALEEAYPVE